MKLRTRLLLESIPLIEDGRMITCCGAISAASYYSALRWGAAIRAIRLMEDHFDPHRSKRYLPYWPTRIRIRGQEIGPKEFNSKLHQRRCVTPRIIALQLLALISEETK